MRFRFLSLLLAAPTIAGCICARGEFAAEDKAATTLTAEISRLTPSCERWFVRECEAGGVKAVWLFRPRIDGPAEASAYDGASGELLYQRQFGTSNGWAFTPVRTYGAAPACRPSLDSVGAERACAWISARGAPAPSPTPAETATPASSAPTPAPSPSPAPTP
jgi:hypothetical protein